MPRSRSRSPSRSRHHRSSRRSSRSPRPRSSRSSRRRHVSSSRSPRRAVRSRHSHDRPHPSVAVEPKPAPTATGTPVPLSATGGVSGGPLVHASSTTSYTPPSGTFVWKKKKELDRELGISSKERRRLEEARRIEAAAELERLAQRKAEREAEQQQREEDQERMQRESEAAALGDWQTREQEFLRDQARQRAAIRIKAGRAQPIDILAMNLRLASRDPESENTNKGLGDDEEDDELDIEIDVNEPTIIFEHLNLADAQELLQDIEFHFSLAREADQVEFWNCLRTVCQDKIDQLNPKSNTDPVGPNRENVAGIFTGKNHEQLLALEAQINAKLA
ncbi:hypothetical protein H4R33_007205, partial [Dimargaris cristalligena]